MLIKKKLNLILCFLGLFICAEAQIQIGNDIDGEIGGNIDGQSLSMTYDGQVLAIGAPRNSDTFLKAGQVRVFKLNNQVWEQMGSDINGGKERAFFGRLLDISDDGRRLVVGALGSETKVFHFQNNEWIQLGNDIIGEGFPRDIGEVAGVPPRKRARDIPRTSRSR